MQLTTRRRPSRGLLHDYEPSDGTFEALVFSVPGASENLHLQSFDGPDRVSKY